MPATGKKRARSPSPEPSDRRKRTKKEKTAAPDNKQASSDARPLPAAADLALDHLLHDALDHPLRQRNLKQVVNEAFPIKDLRAQLKEPLARLMEQINIKEVESSDKQAAVRRELTESCATRVVKELGKRMRKVLAPLAAGLQIRVELQDARIELKLQPLVPVVESDSDADASEEENEEEVDGDEREVAVGHGHEEDDGIIAARAGGVTGMGMVAVKEEEGVKPRASESVMGSGIGEEPPSPENSGEESDGGQEGPGQNWHAPGLLRFNTAHPVRPAGCTINYYPRAVAPAKSLILTVSKEIKKSGRNATSEQVAAAVNAVNPGRFSCHALQYYKDDWLVVCSTPEAASNALQKRVVLHGHPVKLAPFQQRWTQTFVCQSLLDRTAMAPVADDLLLAFPKQRFFLGWLTKSRGKQQLVLIFEHLGDINNFKLPMRLPGGSSRVLKFDSQTRTEPCHTCPEHHPLAECQKLWSLELDGGGGRLLDMPPRVRPLYAPVD